MNKFVFLCAITLAILCLSHEISALHLPPPLEAMREEPKQNVTTKLQDVEIVNDIRTFMVQHPNLNLIRLYKKEPINKSQTVKYSLGNRIGGDRLVAQFGDTLLYPAVKDVTAQVTYPAAGGEGGSVVTFVEIDCLQDRLDGNAYVVAGGVGQRFISIVLEATQTERFSYNVHVFGSQ